MGKQTKTSLYILMRFRIQCDHLNPHRLQPVNLSHGARGKHDIGLELEAEFGVKHLPSDFKKHNGYLRSLQLSEQYGLYRQDYCGCEFSAKARGIEG